MNDIALFYVFTLFAVFYLHVSIMIKNNIKI